MEHKSGCLICGSELVYLKNPEEIECMICKDSHEGDVKCTEGHFVCDGCHSLPANDLIEKFCINSTSEDPIGMALALMRNPNVRMHGPEHHFLVPAVLLACYYNIKDDQTSKEKKIRSARRRAEKVPGGFCGSHGSCAAAVGTGIFISLITEATPLSKEEWRLSNLMTSISLQGIANIGGPRCCKRDSFLAILLAVDFLKDNFDVKIKTGADVRCEFSRLNRECLGTGCPFYNVKSDNP